MIEIEIGRGKRGRRAYSFDDIAVVPSRRTRDPEEVSVSWQIDAYQFALPVIAAPMDSVMTAFGNAVTQRPLTSGLLGLVILREGLAGVEVDAVPEHPPEVLLAPHDALREACGAAGVNDVQVVAAARTEVALGALAFERVVAVSTATCDHPADPVSVVAFRRGERRWRRPPAPG